MFVSLLTRRICASRCSLVAARSPLRRPAWLLVAKFFCILLVGAVLPSCVVFKGGAARKRGSKQAPRATAVGQRFVGTVTLVNSADGFVLIDLGMQPAVASGTRLKTRTEGADSGEVLVGDVHKRPFVIADVVNGSPQKGDQVFE